MRSLTFLALAALGLVSSAARPAVAGTLLVPQQFSTIQAALNAAKPYDTVLVSAKPKGAYKESLIISTPNLVLQGSGNPVIDGSSYPTTGPAAYPSGVEIRADSVAVRGLTIKNAAGGGITSGYFAPDGSAAFSFSSLEISGDSLLNDGGGVYISGFPTRAADGTLSSPQGISVTGCLVTGSTGDGVNISGTSNLVVSGNRITGSTQNGLSLGIGFFALPAKNIVVAGNQCLRNGYDGIDVAGTGLQIAGNESAANGEYGIYANAAALSLFGPAPTTAPAPSAVYLNSIHDNARYGLYASSTLTISANSINRNTGLGIFLLRADKSTVTYNFVTGTVQDTSIYAAQVEDNGSGIVADGSTSLTDTTGNALTISGNQVSGNTGDGIYLGSITGSTVSYNSVVNNSEIGIHLSDYSSGTTDAPDTVTQNQAVHNALYDARDDSNAAADLTYNGTTYSGDNYYYGPSLNIWTKNLFGTTDPVGLSK